MRPTEVARAVAAAISTASTLDLTVDDAVVLHNSNKLAVRLLPCDVFARVAPRASQVARFELTLAARLAETGSPVAALEPRVAPVAYEHDGFVVTLWTYYEPVTSREVSPADYAKALVRLHAGMRTLDLMTPRYTDRVAEAQQLVADQEKTPALADSDRKLLADTLSGLRRTIADRGAAEQLLRGEPHPGNLLDTKDGPLFIDLETCCRGPVEFDLAHVPEEVARHYPGADRHLLAECRGLVLAMVAAWRWDAADQFPNGARVGRELVSVLRKGPPWPTLGAVMGRLAGPRAVEDLKPPPMPVETRMAERVRLNGRGCDFASRGARPMSHVLRTLATDILFGEGPRWRDGRLWFSDFHARAVKSVSLAGDLRVEFEIDDMPSGLGWMPDGSLLVVSMQERRVLRRHADGRMSVHADLNAFAAFHCNDMVVDGAGRAYVGNFGFDLDAEMARRGAEAVFAEHGTASLCLVSADGAVSVAAGEMHFPNGAVITPDGASLIVAETMALRLTAFDIGEDGGLSNRRLWADTAPRAPDGISLDAEGAIWISNPIAPECVRIAEGGKVLDVVQTGDAPCYANMLGGEDGAMLFMLTAPALGGAIDASAPGGRLLATQVDTPHAGWP